MAELADAEAMLAAQRQTMQAELTGSGHDISSLAALKVRACMPCMPLLLAWDDRTVEA